MSMGNAPMFTSSLMIVPSRLFGLFSSSTTTLPACTTFLIEIKGFTTLSLLNIMHLCTPSKDSDGMVFSPKSSMFSQFAATNFFAVVVLSSFTRGNVSAGMTCPAAPVSIVALMSTQLSLTSMTVLGDAQALFSTLSNDSWANFFVISFDFLLVTCHCSFSHSSKKHHACKSSSSSCTSSLRSFLSDSCSNYP